MYTSNKLLSGARILHLDATKNGAFIEYLGLFLATPVAALSVRESIEKKPLFLSLWLKNGVSANLSIAKSAHHLYMLEAVREAQMA